MYLNIDRQHPNQIALIDDRGQQMTYGELTDFINNYPSILPQRSLVFALTRNEVSFVAQLLALIHQGHVPLLLSAELEASLLQKLTCEYQPRALLLPQSLKKRFHYRSITSFYDYCLLETKNEIFSLHQDLELLLSTSGSTGSPKLVRFAKGNMEANAHNVAEVFGWTCEERHICSLPINYVMGLNAMLSHLVVGATILLTDANLMQNSFWEFIRNQRATNFTGVPFSYELLLRLRPERMDLPHLKTFAQGGGKLSKKTFSRMAALAKKQGWRFIATYGTTETCARCAFLPPEMAETKTLSIGMAIPNVAMRLIDSNGHIVKQNHKEGELIIEGNNVSMGYGTTRSDLKKGDEFKGRYKTGDIAYFDDDGCFYIKGRTHRFIKMLGKRISLDESEQILQENCNVTTTCIGREDFMIILTPNSDGHEVLQSMIASKLKLQPSLFKVIQCDILPRNSSGKILYHQLEQRFLSD